MKLDGSLCKHVLQHFCLHMERNAVAADARDGDKVMMAVFVSVFSLAVGVLYCIVSGLMAIDIVPRRATGAALGIVGISSYMTIGIQNIVSGLLLDRFATHSEVVVDGVTKMVTEYNFVPVAIFWLSAVLISFVLPVLSWKKMRA